MCIVCVLYVCILGYEIPINRIPQSSSPCVCMYECVCLFLDCEQPLYIIYNRCTEHVKCYTLAMADNYTTIQQQKPQTITTKPNNKPSKQQQQSNNQAFIAGETTSRNQTGVPSLLPCLIPGLEYICIVQPARSDRRKLHISNALRH